jgi:hypothetical protein
MSKLFELISGITEPESLSLNLPYPDIKDLLTVAIICGISILLSALWLLALCEYTWLKGKYLTKSKNGSKR